MKNLLLLKALIILMLSSLFTACKKESVQAPAISVSIDGSTASFNSTALAFYFNPNDLVISALTGTGLNADKMTLEIQSTGAITAGTYTEFSASSGRVAYYKYAVGYYQALGTVVSPNPFSITITSINADSVTGYFSGDVTLDGTGSSNRKVLANGLFKVAF